MKLLLWTCKNNPQRHQAVRVPIGWTHKESSEECYWKEKHPHDERQFGKQDTSHVFNLQKYSIEMQTLLQFLSPRQQIFRCSERKTKRKTNTVCPNNNLKEQESLAHEFCTINSLKPKAAVWWLTVPLWPQPWCCEKDGGEKTQIMLPLRKF